MNFLSWLKSLFKKSQPPRQEERKFTWAVELASRLLRTSNHIIVVSRSFEDLRTFAGQCSLYGVRSYVASANSRAFPHKLAELFSVPQVICVSTSLATVGWKFRGNIPDGAHFICLDQNIDQSLLNQLSTRFSRPTPTLVWNVTFGSFVLAYIRKGVFGHFTMIYYGESWGPQAKSLEYILAQSKIKTDNELHS